MGTRRVGPRNQTTEKRQSNMTIGYIFFTWLKNHTDEWLKLNRQQGIALVEVRYRWNCYADGSETVLVDMLYRWSCCADGSETAMVEMLYR